MTALAEKQNAALIEAQDVAVRFGGHTVLDSVSLQVEPGEIVTLIGLNGSGKTTLVRVMLGLLPPDSGQVVRRKGLVIGYVPQRLHVDGTLPLTVDRFLRLGTEAARADVAAALEEVGVGKVAGQQIARLSGGEFHRVMLARSLLRNPQLLVLDEPMSGVDVAGQTELYSLIARIRDDRGCGILLVSHDLHIVMAATDRVVCLNHHICCTGRPDSVTRNPAFRALFGEQVAQSVALYHHHHDHVHAADGDVVPLQHEDAGH